MAKTTKTITVHPDPPDEPLEVILLHASDIKLAVVASRSKKVVKCPSCGNSSDLAILADGTLYEHYIAWCPCGSVFIRPVYSFYSNSTPQDQQSPPYRRHHSPTPTTPLLSQETEDSK